MFLICLITYLTFPVNNIFQQIMSSFIFLFILPVIYIKFILKKNLTSYGFQLGNIRYGISLAVFFVFFSSLIFYFLLHYTKLTQFFNLPNFVTQNFKFFLLYSSLIVFFTFLYEFFFKGLLMFGIFKNQKKTAILFQFIIFSIFLLVMGGLKWSNLLYISISIFSGITAYQSRSLVFSFAVTSIFIIIANALTINFLKQ